MNWYMKESITEGRIKQNKRRLKFKALGETTYPGLFCVNCPENNQRHTEDNSCVLCGSQKVAAKPLSLGKKVTLQDYGR
jgi:hypothetical protein